MFLSTHIGGGGCFSISRSFMNIVILYRDYEQLRGKHVHITKTPCYVNKEVKREESKEHQISII